MLCLSLAEGEISPADLTSQQKSLLEERNQSKQQKPGALRNRALQKFSSSSSCTSHYFFNIDNISVLRTENIFRSLHIFQNILFLQ